jgi:hypothetical protein
VASTAPSNHAAAVMYHTRCFPSPRDYLLGRGPVTRSIRSVSPSPSRGTTAGGTNTKATTVTTAVVSRRTPNNTVSSPRGAITLTQKRSVRQKRNVDLRPRAFCRVCRRRRKVSQVLVFRVFMRLLALLKYRLRLKFSRARKFSCAN